MILNHLFKPGNRADPRLFDKDYLFLSALAKELRKAATSLIVKNATILDVGSVYKPYMSLFEEKYQNFFSMVFFIIILIRMTIGVGRLKDSIKDCSRTPIFLISKS